MRSMRAAHGRPMYLARSFTFPPGLCTQTREAHRVNHTEAEFVEKGEGVGTHLLVVAEGEGPHEAVVAQRERLGLVRGHGLISNLSFWECVECNIENSNFKIGLFMEVQNVSPDGCRHQTHTNDWASYGYKMCHQTHTNECLV